MMYFLGAYNEAGRPIDGLSEKRRWQREIENKHFSYRHHASESPIGSQYSALTFHISSVFILAQEAGIHHSQIYIFSVRQMKQWGSAQ